MIKLRTGSLVLRNPTAWLRISSSVALMAIGSFCALQAVIAGIAYGDMFGIREVANQAVQVQHRGQQYFWACVLFQILNAFILAPLLSSLKEESNRSVLLQIAFRYLSALFITVVGTSAGLGLLIGVLRR